MTSRLACGFLPRATPYLASLVAVAPIECLSLSWSTRSLRSFDEFALATAGTVLLAAHCAIPVHSSACGDRWVLSGHALRSRPALLNLWTYSDCLASISTFTTPSFGSYARDWQLSHSTAKWLQTSAWLAIRGPSASASSLPARAWSPFARSFALRTLITDWLRSMLSPTIVDFGFVALAVGLNISRFPAVASCFPTTDSSTSKTEFGLAFAEWSARTAAVATWLGMCWRRYFTGRRLSFHGAAAKSGTPPSDWSWCCFVGHCCC